MPGSPTLPYESAQEGHVIRRRPKWVYAIAVTYALVLLGLATSTAWLPLLAGERPNAYLAAAASILIIAELSLLLTPVRLSSRRPMTRRALWIPLSGSGFLAGLIFIGAGISLVEYYRKDDSLVYGVFLAAGALWIIWAVVFWLISFRAEPGRVARSLHRILIAGSVLELLIAVPTHIVCRRRPDCCAGVYTGLGICCGVAVMLLAFGPSVAFLYYRRWKQIQLPEHVRPL